MPDRAQPVGNSVGSVYSTTLGELLAPVPIARAFPDGVEFVPAEPAVVVVRVPDTRALTPALIAVLGDLAAAVREAYGGGVDVIDDDRAEVYAALDTIRRHVDR